MPRLAVMPGSAPLAEAAGVCCALSPEVTVFAPGPWFPAGITARSCCSFNFLAIRDGRRHDGEWSLISARGAEAIKNKDDEFAAKMLPVADAIWARGLTTLLRSKTSRGADEWTPTAVRNLLLHRPTKGPVP
jgi:hypothetical protein